MTGYEIIRYVIGLLLLAGVIYREEMTWPNVLVLGGGVGLIAGAS